MGIDQWVRRGSALVLAVCVVGVALTSAQLWRVAADQSGATGYRVGETVDVPSAWYRANATTLLVFVRSDCAASQALVTRLPELRKQLPGLVKVFAVVSNSPVEVAFAESAGFDRSAIGTTDFGALRLRVVPTFVLVGNDGRVKLEQLGTGGADRPDILSELWTLTAAS